MKKVKNILITGVFFICSSPILASLPSGSQLYFADYTNHNVKQDCTKAQNNKLMAKAQCELVTTAFDFLEGDGEEWDDEQGESFGNGEHGRKPCAKKCEENAQKFVNAFNTGTWGYLTTVGGVVLTAGFVVLCSSAGWGLSSAACGVLGTALNKFGAYLFALGVDFLKDYFTEQCKQENCK